MITLSLATLPLVHYSKIPSVFTQIKIVHVVVGLGILEALKVLQVEDVFSVFLMSGGAVYWANSNLPVLMITPGSLCVKLDLFRLTYIRQMVISLPISDFPQLKLHRYFQQLKKRVTLLAERMGYEVR